MSYNKTVELRYMFAPLLKRYDLLLLFIILLVGFFLRAYNLPSRVGFDFDQEYAAMFAQNVLQVYPIQMIGQGLSVQGLFMGPFYFYYLVPFFAFTHLDPIGGYIGSLILGLITITTYFFLLKNAFGVATGLIAAFTRAILFITVQTDLSMAPSYGSELAVLITWYSLFKYWQGNTKHLALLSFVFGMYTSFHPILFPFYFVFLLFFVIKRKLPTLKILFISIICFLIPLFPLLRFEYYRHFLEVKTLFSLHGTSAAEKKTFATFLSYITIVFEYPTSLFGIPLAGPLKTIFCFLFYITGTILIIKKNDFWKNNFHVLLLLSTVAIFLGYYFILPTHVPSYYLLGVQTIVFIYTALSMGILFKTKLKFFVFVLLTIVTFFNISSFITDVKHPTSVTLFDKEYLLSQIKQRQKNNHSYAIVYNIDAGQAFGLGYLRRYYNLDDVSKPKVTYEIIIPPSRTTDKPNILSPSGNAAVIIRNH